MSEQTDRYHRNPFTGFASRDEARRKQIVTLPMDVILAIVRERLAYYGPTSDPDATAQFLACEIERAMGVFPNLNGQAKAEGATMTGAPLLTAAKALMLAVQDDEERHGGTISRNTLQLASLLRIQVDRAERAAPPLAELRLQALRDGRPEGWTEALALAFIGEGRTDPADAFAQAFNEGDWLAILTEWPEFDAFVRAQP